MLTKNTKFSFGKDDIGQEEFEQAIKDLNDAHASFLTTDADRKSAKNDRRAKMRSLQSLITSARSGIRSKFGSDSTEYELSGCKRDSARQKPRRKNGNGNGNGGAH